MDSLPFAMYLVPQDVYMPKIIFVTTPLHLRGHTYAPVGYEATLHQHAPLAYEAQTFSRCFIVQFFGQSAETWCHFEP